MLKTRNNRERKNRQVLFKAKYCPRVSAVAYRAHKTHKKLCDLEF